MYNFWGQFFKHFYNHIHIQFVHTFFYPPDEAPSVLCLLNGSGMDLAVKNFNSSFYFSFGLHFDECISFSRKKRGKNGEKPETEIFSRNFFFFVISRNFFLYIFSYKSSLDCSRKKIKYVLESSWCVLLAKWMSLSKYLLIFEKLTQTFVQFFFTQTLSLDIFFSK